MDTDAHHPARQHRSPPLHVTELPPIPPDNNRKEPTLQKRLSVRVRPSDILDNAEPPSPLNQSSSSAPSSRSSKMSLFSLFSRPKFERQRGYVEPGLDGPPAKDAPASRSNLAVHLEPECAVRRPASIMSVKTTATRKSSRRRIRPSSRSPQPKERKLGSFEPPPLFQVYPQSIKDGILEVSSISVETLNKAKSKKPGSSAGVAEKAAGDRSSVETKRTSALKHIANGSVELPKKIFVLITSGYLLQYADSGSSDRLPEKTLQLGKDSAAFACDLVPGKHYVLQVSQAVDQDGIIVANSGSILAWLGIKGAAAKRVTSNFVLVLPNAQEMESWMMILRQEIEALGGKKSRPQSRRPSTRDGGTDKTDLKKTPSQSHRYQVKRDPNEVSNVTSPRPDQTSFPPLPTKADDDKSETATIDDIEMEAKSLDGEERLWIAAATHGLFELPEIQSSPMLVFQQPEFDNTHDTSKVEEQKPSATQALDASDIPMGPSKSFQSPMTGSLNVFQHNDNPSKSSEPLSSAPKATRKAPPSPLNLKSQTHLLKRPIVEESPIIPNYPLPPPRNPKRLTMSKSEPNLHSIPSPDKHDSKVPNLPVASTVEAGQMEARDVVGSPSDTSILGSIALSSPQSPAAIPSPTASVELNKARKVGSFSMPLRVNPSATHGHTSSGNIRRYSRMDEPDSVRQSQIIHALTPSVDEAREDSGSYIQPSAPSAKPTGHKLTPSGRLSLFPNPSAMPPTTAPEYPKRTSSISSRQSYSLPLRRPNSMQVRSDHAPSLSSARNSGGAPAATTVPIRGMKPSRSASNVAALAQQHSSSLEAFKALRFDTPTLEEEADRATPLPVEGAAPASRRTSSRNSTRKSLKGRSSLVDIDFGVDVNGFGPPAPPPQAPLPAPPSGSRASSPTPMHHQMASISSITGLGISV